MTGEAFVRLYADRWLHHEINKLCSSRSRRKCIRDEYRQEAWLWIGTAPGGYVRDYYVKLAEKAIKSAYWQHRRDLLTADECAEMHEASLLAIAHNLAAPPHYSTGYMSPCHPGSDGYPLDYDPQQGNGRDWRT